MPARKPRKRSPAAAAPKQPKAASASAAPKPFKAAKATKAAVASAALLKLPAAPWSKELVRLYPDAFSLTRGLSVQLSPGRAEGYEVSPSGNGLAIAYCGQDDLMLALGDLMAGTVPPDGAKIPALAFRGIMLDASRNAVPRADFLKDRIARLALLGLNRFCLYAEDTYPVKGEPLFGYARGRYTNEDLRSVARHAKAFGVEMFPCIQTLGHMEHILKYPHYVPLKDNEYVYNVYAKDVYAFIEKTIDAAMVPFDTKTIHIGMDETFGLGRGLAFKEGEPIHPRRMYVEHVKKVVAICRAKGLTPIMWGDIVLGHGTEQAMGEEAAGLPKDVVMDYWNYAWDDPAKYDKEIGEFAAMGYNPIVSPAVWGWSRFFPAYYKAESNVKTLVESAKRNKARGALNTHWGDDGHECFFDYNLPAHVYFLAQCTEQGNEAATARARFAAAFGCDFDEVRSTEQIDLAGTKPQSLIPANIGKCFFYDDPAQGLFSGLPFVKPAGAFYAGQAKKMAALAKSKGMFQSLFRFAQAFCAFLAVKADLRRRAATAYKRKDKAGMLAAFKEIPLARKRLAEVRTQYRAYWLSERSPFGLEIVDGRMGMLDARLDHLGSLLKEHLAGRMPVLEELDFDHFSMYHDSRSPDYQPSIWPEFMIHYSGLASRNPIKWW